MYLYLLVIGLIAVALGLGLIYWINRRKFNRRNGAGLEGFSSYEKSVLVRFLERVGKWAAYILIIYGIVSILVYRQEKKRVLEKRNGTTMEQPIKKSDG